ncbi:regulatory protein RecX [Leptotrichia sp. oral taxon 221]|uniref:regulatory protein RecX n=1 Tax=Leptotrichia sp. oral taxon 221 TaxID=712362 RepID=UPI001B8C1367|nr:regulatory protein RecX [Leptotrichia sp. oral taxon 221]QUB96662.1 regulatory protein RecX [Leptotrichia sp. oral taxon 221]
MKIIKKIQRNKLYLDNEEIMDVSPLIRQKYNLKVNDDIESLYDDVSYEASLEKGIFIISLKDRTKKELQTKLNEKYFNAKMVQKAVQKLEELGYINDLDYTISYINNRKYGKNRISYNLFQKGINRETIDKAYNIIEEEMEKNIEDRKLEKAILKHRKKLLVDDEEKDTSLEGKMKRLKEEQKVIQSLARQGFEIEKIFSKLKEFKESGFEE